ncbi:MAG: ParB N-terminal domain-containing protein [Pseudomonadota bacterium]
MTIEYKALNDLVIARENTRKTRSHDQIKTLAASIEAVGILHTLVGYEENGKTHITDGGSRLKALRLLAKGDAELGDLLKKIPVSLCNKAHAIDVSLTANLVRQAMTPADQFTAFHKLHHVEQVAIEEIAQRYFVDSLTVKRILKLASLAKPIFEAFKAGDVSLEIARIYAGCGDIDRQLSVFDECGVDASPYRIRRALRENTYLATAAKVEFVGLQAYLDKGGVLEDDLFEEKTVLLNGEIIDDLMVEAIETLNRELLTQGWSEVHYSEDRETHWSLVQKLGYRLHPKLNPTKKQQKTLDKLQEKMEAFETYWRLSDEDKAKYDALEKAYNQIEQDASAFDPTDIETGLCYWYFSDNGPEIGYFKPREQTPKPKKVEQDYADRFQRDVMASAGDALMEHLIANPNAITTALAIAALESFRLPCVNFDKKTHGKRKFDRGNEDGQEDAPRFDSWNTSPSNMIDRVKELVAMSETERQSALATVMRQAFTLGEQGSDYADQKALFDLIAEQSNFTLSDYWQFGEDELKCLTKAQLLRVLGTMGQDPVSLSKAKKSELVMIAARYAKQQQWTPEFIRPSASEAIQAPLKAAA